MLKKQSLIVMSVSALAACSTTRRPSSVNDKYDSWRGFAESVTSVNPRIDAQTVSLMNPFYSSNSLSLTLSNDSWHDFSMGPFIFFDLQTPKVIRSLQMLDSEPHLAVRTLTDTPSPAQFEAPADDQPFRVVIRSQILGGAGPAFFVGDVHERFGASFSLAPIVGRYRVSTRLAHSRAEAQAMKALPIPRVASDLDSWQVGDKLDWATSGGLVFSAGPSYWGLFAGGQYLAQGKWGNSVEKLSPTRYRVEIVKGSVQALSLVVNAQLVAVTPGVFRDADNQFSFLVDVSDPAAKAALDDYLKGKLTSMQKLSDDPAVAAVAAYENSRTLSKGRMVALDVGIPYLSFRRGVGNVHSMTDTVFNPDGSKSDIRYGVAMDVTSARFFNKSSNYSLGFIGANYETTLADGTKATGYSGQFGYDFDKNLTTDKDLQDAIARVGRVTGLMPEMMALMPTGTRYDTNLGATSVDFMMTINQEATDALMNFAASDGSVNLLQMAADREMMAYFGVPVDDLTPKAGEFSNQPPRVKFSDVYSICSGYVNCPPYIGNDTHIGIRNMIQSLRLMRAALNANNRDAFVNAYAKFGQGMMATPFAFQVALDQVRNHGVAAFYSVGGENLKQHEVLFNWSH